jgi:hypothetical protein
MSNAVCWGVTQDWVADLDLRRQWATGSDQTKILGAGGAQSDDLGLSALA